MKQRLRLLKVSLPSSEAESLQSSMLHLEITSQSQRDTHVIHTHLGLNGRGHLSPDSTAVSGRTPVQSTTTAMSHTTGMNHTSAMLNTMTTKPTPDMTQEKDIRLTERHRLRTLPEDHHLTTVHPATRQPLPGTALDRLLVREQIEEGPHTADDMSRYIT